MNPSRQICDDEMDCPNGSDEGPGCDANECSRNGCSNTCQQTPVGPLCTCPMGEVLNTTDTRVCQGMDHS